jgi:aryl-alcohol dehydrogenase-like predicted oxidoreductase
MANGESHDHNADHDRIGYGAMQLPGPGVWGPPADPDAARAVLRRALDLGVTHIDTSDFYGPHVANDLIREALHPYPAGLTIATKVGAVRSADRMFQPAARPEQLRDQVHSNLAHLGLDRLDLVYLRAGGDGLLPPDGTPFAESFGALAELRADGLVGRLGLSGVTVAQIAEAQAVAPVAAVQNRFNLFDRSGAAELTLCEERGLTFVPYFPLAPWAQSTAEQTATVERIGAAHGATWSQVLLAWLLAVSPATFLIPGTKSVAHLEENMAAARIRLTEAEVKELTASA